MNRWSILLIIPLGAAVLWLGCDLFMGQLSKGPAPVDDTDPDASGDAGVDWCPGYTGEQECCDIHDTCTWADDGFCDCDGFCEWDDADCGGGDTDTDTDTDSDTDSDADGGPDGGVWCVGYEGDDECCLIDDPCEYAGDDYCDCDATCDWDWEDC